MKRVFCLTALLFLGVLPVVAQATSSGWEFESAQHLGDLIDGDYTFSNAVLSLDGSTIFWQEVEDEAFCVYKFAGASTNCFPWDEDARLQTGRYNYAALSPDGSQVALYENVFLYFRDSDIWMMDTATGQFTNRTDDHFDGNLLVPEDSYALDYLPTWNPSDGTLYFFRSVKREAPADETGYTLELYRLPDTGDPELVSDLTERLPGPFAVYSGVAFSPDGTQLAMIVLPSDWLENPGAGVWVLDLPTDTITQVATMEDFTNGLPDWFEDPLIPMTVAFSQEGLVVFASTPPGRDGFSIGSVFVRDETTGKLNPLFDYTDVENEADAFRADAEIQFDTPRAGAVSPDASAFWYLNYSFLTRESGVSELALVPGSEPTLLTDIQFTPQAGMEAPASVSSDGKLLIFDLLMTFQPE